MVLLRICCLCLLAATGWADEDAPAIVRQLKELQKNGGPAALDAAWPHLDSEDGAIRDAARKAIQAQPFETWKARALEEKGTWASLEMLRALVESCPRNEGAQLSPHLCEQITTLRIEHMDEPQLLVTMSLTRLVFDVLGPLTEDERRQMLDLWSALPPPSTAFAAKERLKLLEFLRSVRPRLP